MYRASQLLASTKASFSLTKEASTIAVSFINNNTDELLTRLHDPANSLSLHFENMKGNDLLPVIDVYLNLIRENNPEEENYIGSMGLYGLGESSGYSGAGQDRILDAGQVFSRVHHQSNWSKEKFWLTLLTSRPLPAAAELAIGRITLYFHES